MNVLISLALIFAISYGMYERWQKQALAYFVAKKDIHISDEEIRECLAEVLKKSFKRR